MNRFVSLETQYEAAHNLVQNLIARNKLPTHIVAVATGGVVLGALIYAIVSRYTKSSFHAIPASSEHGTGDNRIGTREMYLFTREITKSQWLRRPAEQIRILVVDEICDSGNTLKDVIADLTKGFGLLPSGRYEILSYTYAARTTAAQLPDFCDLEIPANETRYLTFAGSKDLPIPVLRVGKK
jgi:hypoxanthine phosphoribosyltransferase